VKLLEKDQAVASLAEYIDELGRDTIVVTSEGKPVAVLAGVKNGDIESVSLSTNPKFMSIIERARRRYKDEGGTSSEDVRRMFAKDLTS
jgi:antitoxin (DNA-binding transcriptional repressor) of toxin-antitoxin stability system